MGVHLGSWLAEAVEDIVKRQEELNLFRDQVIKELHKQIEYGDVECIALLTRLKAGGTNE